PIGCAVDFVCRLLHLKIISLKKPLQIGLCNKAVAGLFLNLIYVWTRNIWHVLLIHFMNNAVLSLGGVILLKAVTMLT
ncbi:type II CAAX prenyl endopeptidase Rce1 family protein, partial [Acinetobacter wanghuae]|uniref:CPBP family glutamic-type intramembrane protease n=1 Tax=Acinetobacter wanghuae TaxID=2662362 RepID=UPI003AF5E47D